MKFPGSSRRTSALLVSSTMGLALSLAGCTSVEVASKADIQQPKLAATTQPSPDVTATPTQTPATANSGEATAAQTAQIAATQAGTAAAPAGATVSPAGATVASTATAAQVAGPTMASAVAVKGGRVALPPASEIAAAAAAAAIDAQIQPQAPAQQVALAAPAATAPAVAAVAHQTSTSAAALPQVVALKGGFPPAPSAPGTPSAAPIPLTEEMMKQQSVIPVPKPQGAMLAYASAPQNAALAAISTREGITTDGSVMAGRQKLSGLITKYATMYDVPEDLVHRVVQRESRYNPGAFNGGHFGLMQIKHATARSMGFDGPASGLFDAETNLKYAVKYLRGAWLVADNNRDNAVRLYARGYYYDAKRRGMLHVLRK
ncbi:lytic transglycosylase [Rhizobium sp. Leaf311]|uniref:lytic transglycosylase domain-containing protein n=1 Tax=Rhizobium sp. Leaf311 TaxID=1736332 RepID=UPI00071390B6|nr:lytic transglycosylase domain-containing protein [Rhizobium sp. Leaf311]KQQ61470.1 lytic transglycosylase [Rhizobium sp. Leaf311]